MAGGRLAKRYAKSLLELSTELNKTERVKTDVEQILTVMNESREFRNFVKSPVIKPDVKARVFKEIFGSELDELTTKFIDILFKKGREGHVEGIVMAFEDLYRAQQGIQKAVVTTAYELTEAEKSDIEAKVKEMVGGQVEIEAHVDPSIIGGLKLRIGDKQFNGSIAAQLNNLRREFQHNHYIADF